MQWQLFAQLIRSIGTSRNWLSQNKKKLFADSSKLLNPSYVILSINVLNLCQFSAPLLPKKGENITLWKYNGKH